MHINTYIYIRIIYIYILKSQTTNDASWYRRIPDILHPAIDETHIIHLLFHSSQCLGAEEEPWLVLRRLHGRKGTRLARFHAHLSEVKLSCSIATAAVDSHLVSSTGTQWVCPKNDHEIMEMKHQCNWEDSLRSHCFFVAPNLTGNMDTNSSSALVLS